MKPAMHALVIEDDRSWQQILHELLNDAGLEVDLAVDLNEALALIARRTHRLAVVDLSLVTADHLNRDGFKVLREIRLRDPGCISVLLTGFATVEIAVSALTDLGVYTCLRKEMFQRGEFRELVRKAISVSPVPDAPTPGRSLENQEATILPDRSDVKERLSVIIVEDDAGWQSILSELLTDEGFHIRVCQSFGEAFGCMRRENYQLAVIDLSLDKTTLLRSQIDPSYQPDWDGYRLLASTRSAGIPTIVVSGIANADEIERVYQEQGIFSFIEKQSFDRRIFIKTVKEAVKTHPDDAHYHALTVRELEVLEMLSQGLTNKEIAEGLFITPNTVKRHLKSIFEKLEIHTRSAAAAMAASWFGTGLGDEKRTH